MPTATDQEQRISELREQLKELNNDTANTIARDISADEEEQFLRHVLECETAEPITLFLLLTNRTGAELPAPDTLEDAGLTIILMKTANDLASLGVYLTHTDHLSDRELYTYLYNDGLREEAVLFPENPSYAYVIDLVGSGSDADTQNYLKFYATEENRKQWKLDWPDDHIPEHESAPFDRDRHLPQAPLG